MSSALSDVRLLSRLVGFDSTSRRSNLPIADFICDYLDEPGIEIVRNPNADEDKVNLVIRIGGANGSASGESGLILSGHMDVVPAREPEWVSDPFQLSERDGNLYGRGSADMKGFLALAINLARQWSQEDLEHPLVLLLTFDEELGLLGAQHFARTWGHDFPLPRNAVIGEPTELRVVRMHKGHLQVRITVRGVSAHSAYPHLGRSAIEPAAQVVLALKELRRQFEKERHDTSGYYPETPFVALNVGMIQGGSAVNVIPDRCVIDISARNMPGQPPDEVVSRVRAKVESLGLPDCQVEFINEAASLLSPADSRVHRGLCGLVGQNGQEAVSYASDAGVFQGMGINCVLYGPGTIEVAHKPNECVPLEHLQQARTRLHELIREFCA
ncbi:MAG TPA: acetylornithine deacetylase [Acidobacteriota bacterium]|nr:acetylornithine deacetylase [Acidobacteriota bacterium]